jgi:predicted transcriptional regulator
MLIVCGSATSWIMNKLINNYGGLHNRLTATMLLQPFTVSETEKYLKYRKIACNHYQVAEYYMLTGGVPYYLSKIKKGLSVAQNIDNMFFNKQSELKNEFVNLYKSLFRESEESIKIVEALSKKTKGLTRREIAEATKISTGGTLTKLLQNLDYCGFIRAYSAFGKSKRDVLYQLMDSFTLFYFKYLANNKYKDEHFWTNSQNTPRYNAWRGYAFEIFILQHINEIKKVLGISGIQSAVYSWRSERSENGAQIDLVIDRKDGIINLCEIKFSSIKFSIDKQYEENLRNKIACFQIETKTSKAVHLLMITTFGLQKNKYFGIAQKEITLDDLF